MKKNISIKNIIILLSAVLGGTILIFFIGWLILGWRIETHDKKENKDRAELIYSEQNKKYEMSGGEVFKMDYTYNVKTNIGFLGGGGFTENGCWERYIADAWLSEGIAFISLCQDEKITKEKLQILNNFWEKHEEIFKSKQ